MKRKKTFYYQIKLAWTSRKQNYQRDRATKMIFQIEDPSPI